MSTITHAMFKVLSEFSGLAALVGTRIFPMILPQNSDYPAVTYNTISAPRDYTHDGASGLVAARYQITAWAASYTTAKLVIEQVRLSVSGLAAQDGDASVQVFHVMDETDLEYHEETRIFGIALDVEARGVEP